MIYLSYDSTPKMFSGIDWVIIGGETGTRARPMKKEWVDPIFDVCAELNIPFFFKHWGICNADGKRIRHKDNTYKGQIIQHYPV